MNGNGIKGEVDTGKAKKSRTKRKEGNADKSREQTIEQTHKEKQDSETIIHEMK